MSPNQAQFLRDKEQTDALLYDTIQGEKERFQRLCQTGMPIDDRDVSLIMGVFNHVMGDYWGEYAERLTENLPE